MRRHLLIIVLWTGLVTAGCGTAPITNGGESPPAPHGADQLVLRMEYSPGFAPLPARAPFPAFSLYGDGRIVTADYARRTGSWQRAQESRTDRAGMDRLLRVASAAGLPDAPADPPPPKNPPPDASSARFTLWDNEGGRHAAIVVVPEAHSGALGELFQALSAPSEGVATPYRPGVLAVLRRDESPSESEARRWPLGKLDFAGLRIGTGERMLTCAILHGDQAAQLTAQATDAPQSALWTDGTRTATLELRPLLPDEHSCEDLPMAP
jgi:hypothetical protein